MVESVLSLDGIFGSLSHPIRRDILRRGAMERAEMSVNEIAKPYKISLAAISKHLKILEKAKLIIKRRRGKEQLITISPVAFKQAADYLQSYEKLWNSRLDNLEEYLSTL